jgi:DNA-binding PadR family transcriptional regulator
MAPQLTTQTMAVLSVMLDDPAASFYGLELAHGASLASGTVYPILIRLERAGMLESRWEEIDTEREGRPARRYYRLTAHGARVAEAERGRLLRSLTGQPAEPRRVLDRRVAW